MRFITVPKSIALCTLFAMSVTAVAEIVAAENNHRPATAKKINAKKAGQKRARDMKFNDYKSWKCANSEPRWIPDRIAAACAAPSPQNGTSPSPHDGKFIRVYVNAIARDAMLKRKTPKFARGSAIVKEKLATSESKTAELLTVMVKREAGFDAANGDWEYLVLNGSGQKVQQRGKLRNCQSCHGPQKETDYIFRTYLPAAAERQLR